VRVIACLAEGLGIRGTARVFEVDPNTVLQWLVEAAEQLQAFSRHVLHDVRVQQVRLDELFALLSAVKDHEVSAAEAIERLERSSQWVWVAMDPESKLLLTLEVGDRTLAMAQRVVHQVAQVLAPDCAPLFLTDGFREYLAALLTHYGHWVQPPRRQATGPAPKPRWMPLSELLYAQVVKSYRRKRIVRVTHRVVFGTMDRVKQVLAPCGWQINTAFVERLNLAIRQRVAAVGRRVNTRCKGENGLRQQLVLFQSYHNFVLPHASLRQPLSVPEPTNGRGSTKLWRPCTPAMAVGLTDHVWSRSQRSSSFGCHRGHKHKRCKGQRGKWWWNCADRVCRPAGERSWKRYRQPKARADGRLIDTTQTARVRSALFIRRAQVHDRS
jgi:IS1 family transposase